MSAPETKGAAGERAQHTPGPWVFDEGEVHTVSGGEDDVLLTICQVTSQGPETEANGFVLAAAPELLAALQGELSPMRTDCNERNCGVCSRCRSKAALRKAEGRRQ